MNLDPRSIKFYFEPVFFIKMISLLFFKKTLKCRCLRNYKLDWSDNPWINPPNFQHKLWAVSLLWFAKSPFAATKELVSLVSKGTRGWRHWAKVIASGIDQIRKPLKGAQLPSPLLPKSSKVKFEFFCKFFYYSVLYYWIKF